MRLDLAKRFGLYDKGVDVVHDINDIQDVDIALHLGNDKL